MPQLASTPGAPRQPAGMLIAEVRLPPRVHQTLPQRQRPAGFSAIVLTDTDSGLEAQVDAALRGVGAIDVRFASSPADLLRRIPPPAETGVGVICLSPRNQAVMQLVAQLRRAGWRRILMACEDGDEAAVRIAIAGKVRCLIRRPVCRVAGADDHGRSASLPPPPELPGLSPREVEVLQAVADGHTNNETGRLLGLSGLTVKSHLARIGRKTGTGDRAEMVAIAMRAGLVA